MATTSKAPVMFRTCLTPVCVCAHVRGHVRSWFCVSSIDVVCVVGSVFPPLMLGV